MRIRNSILISLSTLAVLALPLFPGMRVNTAFADTYMPMFQVQPDTVRVLDLTTQRFFNRLYSTGFKYYEIQEYANAIPSLQKCTEIDSTNIDVWYLLATCYFQTEQMIQARDAYQAILRQSPEETAALQSLAYIYKELGEDELHLRMWERLVELTPDNPENMEYMLALYRHRGNDDGMLNLLQRLAEQSPEDAGIRRQIADIHGRRGDIEAQVESLEAARERDPANVRVLEKLGRIYAIDLDEPVEAARIYGLLAEVQPENPVVWRLWGRYLGKSGQPDSAIVALQKSLELAPDETRVYSELALVLSDEGRYDEAVTWVEKAIGQKPDDAYAFVSWGDILQAKAFAVESDDGTVPYEAKIILEEAIEKYRQGLALQSLTEEVRSYAEKEVARLEPYRRTQAEIFMHQARTKIPPQPSF